MERENEALAAHIAALSTASNGCACDKACDAAWPRPAMPETFFDRSLQPVAPRPVRMFGMTLEVLPGGKVRVQTTRDGRIDSSWRPVAPGPELVRLVARALGEVEELNPPRDGQA